MIAGGKGYFKVINLNTEIFQILAFSFRGYHALEPAAVLGVGKVADVDEPDDDANSEVILLNNSTNSSSFSPSGVFCSSSCSNPA